MMFFLRLLRQRSTWLLLLAMLLLLVAVSVLLSTRANTLAMNKQATLIRLIDDRMTDMEIRLISSPPGRLMFLCWQREANTEDWKNPQIVEDCVKEVSDAVQAEKN